jgi:hypothetical protein
MIWHALAIAAWWSSASAGCLARATPVSVPKAAPTVSRDHWAYGAMADLAAAGWDVSNAKARNSGSLDREGFNTIVAQLVTAAAAREQTDKVIPMAQRVLLARLVGEFTPTGSAAAAAARVPGLHPEVMLSPDGSRMAKFAPTSSGAEIEVVDKAAGTTIRLRGDGFNYGPTWSEDGDEVAWIGYADGRTLVWIHSMLGGDEHMIGSALADSWGKLTPVHDGFTLSLPGTPDRLVHIPAHLEPENGGGRSEETAPGEAK